MKNSKEIKQRVDSSSTFYSKFLNIDHKLLMYSFDKLKKYFNGTFALEIGPANGEMTKLLKNEFLNLHLLEASKDLLDQIPNYDNVKKVHGLIENYVSEEKYDTIIMGHVLEHIADPNMVLERIYSLLNSSGTFLVSVPNAKSLHRMVAVEMGMISSVYDMDIFKSHITRAGFKIVHSGGYFLKPLSNEQIEQNWNEEMIDGFYKIGDKFQEYCAEIYAVCSK